MDEVWGGHYAHDDLVAKDEILARMLGHTPSSIDEKIDSEWVEKV